MKNIFKLMGVALMACTLLVACNKDNEEETPQEEQIADGIKVTFGDDSWTAANANECKYYESYGVISLIGSKNAEGLPYFDEAIYATEVGTYTDNCDMNSTPAPGLMGENATHAWCYFYIETGLTTDQTDTYGDWWATTVTTEFKAIDLTGLKLTAVSTGTMFDAHTAYVEGAGMDAAPRKDFKVTFGNVSL